MSRLNRVVLALGVESAIAAGTARADECPDLTTSVLGVGLVEHSCFHTTNGPFASVRATPGTMARADTPNVDPVHTLYSVTIDPSLPSTVTYMPLRSGRWAIFGDADVPHAVFDAAGNPLEVELTHTVPACPAIPVVQVYTLTALTRYTIQLGPAAGGDRTAPVVIEKVSDFEIPHGRDDDGDGYGGSRDVVTTACVPPPGYVRNTADCDDGDRDIHPETVESCDGVDNNCNGVVDEDVCTTTGGGCTGAPRGSTGGGALALFAALALPLIIRRRTPR